jgi:phage shock protein PspC (stress-responsive transcriptional regulator)
MEKGKESLWAWLLRRRLLRLYDVLKVVFGLLGTQVVAYVVEAHVLQADCEN